MSEWNATSYEGKDNLLRIVKNEAAAFFEMVDMPENWEKPTASGHWQVRDIVGHLVDTTEGYLERFDTTRSGTVAEALAPLTDMAKVADERALAFRDVPRGELLTRLKDDYSQAMKMFEETGEEDWGGFVVTHGYMGPMPSWFYPVGQLMDYGIHGWDVREGLGLEHFLGPDVADMLVPFAYIVWQATTVPSKRGDGDLDIAIKTTGHNGGTTRIKVTDDGMTYEAGSEEGAQAVIELDPASLVLHAFGRTRGGYVSGDMDAAKRFANCFFRF
ncbi:MAG: hypothetical protein QOG54_856 [Actinomycetota bacterium]|jgi:uncharacterized protein (TIGR03083 family)|nr:hypothetical protein [Actinomycetota bacterium]